MLFGLLKMEAAHSPEMLEIIHQSIYSHIPGEWKYQNHCKNHEHYILNSHHQSSELMPMIKHEPVAHDHCAFTSSILVPPLSDTNLPSICF